MHSLVFVIIIVVIALLFDFINGMNDAANSIASVVATRVLSPRVAIIWAAAFNFLAVFIFGVSVAKTIGAGIVDINIVTQLVIFCALIGAITWAWTCTIFGFPISVSHALIGGLIGASVTKGGLNIIILPGIIKIFLFIFLAPVFGFIFSIIMMNIVHLIFNKFSPSRVDILFRRLQLFSAAANSLSHGSNDAQKTMGIITVLLYSSGYLGNKFYVPVWVIFACYVAIALGTLAGGWGVINTMGSRITKLKPVTGFCADTAGALTISMASIFGIPISTTHTVTGSIMGVGAIKRASAVHWGVAGAIVWAWILTIPCSAAISAASYLLAVSFK